MRPAFYIFLLVCIIPFVQISAHPADPSYQLSQYSLYGEDSLIFTNAAITADNGWIGSNNYIKMTTYGSVTVGGKTVAGDRFVGADPNSSSSDPTQYKDTIFIDKDGSWTGHVATAPALVDDKDVYHPVFPNFGPDDITIGTEDVLIHNSYSPTGDTVVAPGRYRKILADHGTYNVVFGAGVYEVDTLEVYNTLLIDKEANEFCRILVKSALIIKEHSGTHDQLIEKNGNFGRVLIHVAGEHVELGDNVRIDATILAPNADVEARTGMQFYGQLLAKSVTVTEGFNGNSGAFEPFNAGNLAVPQWVLDGVPEDTLNIPEKRNSYTLEFPITLTEKIDAPTSFKYEILTTATADPKAVISEDFSLDAVYGAAASGTVTFDPNDTTPSETIRIRIIDDILYEPINEYITLRLFQPDSIIFSNSEDTIEYQIPIISEDDSATKPYVEQIVFPLDIQDGVEEDPLNDPTFNNSYLLQFPLTLTGISEWNGSVEYAVLDVAKQNPAAKDIADFVRIANGASPSGKLNFTKGDSVSHDSIRIWIVDDGRIEEDMYVTVRLFNPDGVELENGGTEQFYNFPIISEDDSTSTVDTGGVPDPTSSGVGALFDITGNGLGDRFDLTLNSTTRTVDDILWIEWQWSSTAAGVRIGASELTKRSERELSWDVSGVPGEGSGSAKIIFTDTLYASAPLHDSVGAAIESGFAGLRDGNRLEDTVQLTFTEGVVVPSSGSWLILYDDSASAVGDIVSANSVTSINENLWEITLDKGLIKQGTWVQLTSDPAGVIDKKGNKAHSQNQKVELVVELGVLPVFDNGAIYDRFGTNDRRDGYGDTGIVIIRLAEDSQRVTIDNLETLTLSAPGGDVVVPWTKVDDSTITFSDPSLKGITGEVKASLTFDTPVTISGTLTDSVAPAIVSAVYERWIDGDTLEITFTEDLSLTGNATPFLFTSGNILTLDAAPSIGNVVRYEVVGPKLSGKDTVWIDPVGNIRDAQGVHQDFLENRQVPIKELQIVTPISAWFTDTDTRPDGIADQLTIVTTKPIPSHLAAGVVSEMVLPESRGRVTSVVPQGDTLICLIVTSDTMVANSATDASDVVTLTNPVRGTDTLFYIPSPLQIIDSMAPVITEAEYRFGSVVKSATVDSIVDTLIVTYSEKVQAITTSEPFMFQHKTTLYTMSLVQDLSGGTTVRYERVYRLDDPLPAAGDSIWIDHLGGVTDTANIEQEHDTKPVAITTPMYQTNFVYNLYPNPVILDADANFPNEYLASVGLAESRIAITAAPVGIRPVPGLDQLKATVVLFDVVGNRILKKSDLIPAKGNGRDLVFSFEPKNSNDRRLASGSYLLIVELSGSVNEAYRMMLGVGEKVEDGRLIR